jgi:hypothetical protein
VYEISDSVACSVSVYCAGSGECVVVAVLECEVVAVAAVGLADPVAVVGSEVAAEQQVVV